ncbi:MAG TPA: ABC transporter ATP-binding protein [Candidatus Poseidoniales archaeon]|nr:ABC transporter ATP-binding protein [Candidatus Poseidoniales archaeon]
MTTMISVDDVSLSFPLARPGLTTLLSRKKQEKLKWALKRITLDVDQGEVLGVIGRNGSGKSSLVRVMSGIYSPAKGTVLSRGQLFLLANVRIGFTGNLTGRENAYLYGSILGHSTKKMDELMPEIIEFSELGDYIDQPLRTYSSGMSARLGFSVATAVQPDILLIDEVLSVGDLDFRERSKQRILNMVENAGTVVMVSHSLDLLKKICNRIVFIDDGEVVAIGDPDEVIQTYRDSI